MKKIYLIILFAGAMLCFDSCGLYKKYERQNMRFVDSLYRRLPASEDSLSTAAVSWDKIFTDTLLQDWIRVGLANNTDLNIARFKVEEAQVALTTSRWAFFPGVSLNAKGGTYPGNFSANLDVSWQVDIFGELRNAKRQKKAAMEQSVAYKQAVQTRLVATIANNYYTLLMLDEKLKISSRTRDTWEENIRTLEALKRAGKTNEAAVLQAKANRLDVESSILDLEKEIRAVENSMCALLAVLPMSITRGSLDKQQFPEKLSAGVPVELLSRRPDVREAEWQLAQAFYMTNSAKAAFYPKLNLSGALGWTTGSGSIAIDPGSIIANLVAGLVQPIFDKGVNKARLKTAQVQQEAAAYNFRQSLLDAGVEVNNAIVLWQTAKKQVELDKKQVLYLQASVWNTQLLMKHGNASYLEVLTAQKNLLAAELAEVSDRFDEIQSVINLYQALGGGYSEEVAAE